MDPLPPPSVSSSSDTYVCNFSDTNALSKDYSALLESEQTSDVSLLLACSQHEPMEDGGKAKGKKTKNNQIRLPAHKAILAARSPVFMAMLFGPMKESQLKEVVVGSEFAAETMMQLLRFIYTGTVDNVSMEQLVPLLACADHFQVESLDKQLLSYLERNVTPKNACTILSFAKYYKQEKVIELYTRFVHLHAPKVLKTESFLSLDFDILLILLQSSETRASEIDLWRGAVKWHDHQNPPPKPDKVEKLFSAIRYDQISGPQLVEDVRPKMHLVPKDLYVKALEKVAAPDSVSSYPSLGRRMPPIGSLRVNDPNLLEVTHGTRVKKTGPPGWNCTVLADLSSSAVIIKVLQLEDPACGVGLAIFDPERVHGLYPNPNQWGADNLLGVYGTGNFFGLGFDQVIQWKVGNHLKVVVEQTKAETVYRVRFYSIKWDSHADSPKWDVISDRLEEKLIVEGETTAKSPRVALALYSTHDELSIEPLW